MKYAVINILLYFVVFPAAYVGVILVIDSNPDFSPLGVVSYFAFTAPALPWAIFVVPAVSAVAWMTAGRFVHRRRIIIIAAMIIVGLPVAVVTLSPSHTIIFAAAGALYGALFRVRQSRQTDMREV